MLYIHIFICVIQNDDVSNWTISSHHWTTGLWSPRKNLFVNRNTRQHHLEEQQTLTSDEYFKKIFIFFCFILIFSPNNCIEFCSIINIFSDRCIYK